MEAIKNYLKCKPNFFYLEIFKFKKKYLKLKKLNILLYFMKPKYLINRISSCLKFYSVYSVLFINIL